MTAEKKKVTTKEDKIFFGQIIMKIGIWGARKGKCNSLVSM
jgi:hypothetical protein